MSKKKNFLTQEQEDTLIGYLDDMKSYEWISEKMNIKIRQVQSYAKARTSGYDKNFTLEEDIMIRDLYLSGITKEALIAKYVVKKAPWMIRNRIKKMQRDLIIPSKNVQMTAFQSITNAPANISLIQQPQEEEQPELSPEELEKEFNEVFGVFFDE